MRKSRGEKRHENQQMFFEGGDKQSTRRARMAGPLGVPQMWCNAQASLEKMVKGGW